MSTRTNQPDRANPNAFVKLQSFRKVLAAFRATLGMNVQDGDAQTLAGGAMAISFHERSHAKDNWQFKASLSGGGIRLAGGVLNWAGRTIWFPAATYSGAQPGGVYLKVRTQYTVTANLPSEPWDIIIDTGTVPELLWMETSQIQSTHATLRDTDPTGDETVAATVGTVYFPIAVLHNQTVLQPQRGPLSTYAISSGLTRVAGL